MMLFDPEWVRASKRGSNVARKGWPEKKQTGCVLTTRREGMAKQRQNLKN
jgi:hypothetical protein